MGVTVRQKGGAWWLFICHQGKRKAKRVGVGEVGKRAAKAAAEKIQAKLALGDVGILEPEQPAKAVPTFEAVAKEWEAMIAPNWTRGTKITYGDVLRSRLLPAFGPLPITAMDREHVEAWWTRLRQEGLGKRRLSMLRGILSEICKRAVRLRLLQQNPVEWIEGKIGREETKGRRATYLTREDLTHFLAVAERVSQKEYPIYLVMGTCGLRIGEATGLQVGDLDVGERQVHIRRTVRRGYVTTPKTRHAVRVVDVPETTMQVLQQVKETRKVEAAYDGAEPRWLWPGKAPEMPITPERAHQVFQKVLTAAGIRKIRPHDLRHTYATLAIQAGVPLLSVSRQLGHKSISTTADIYAHAVPGSNRAAADVMEAILAGGNHPQPPRNLPA